MIESSLGALEQAAARKDWKESDDQWSAARKAIKDLAARGAAAPVLLSLPQQPKVDQLRARLGSASDCMNDIQSAILAKDHDRLSATIKKFSDAYRAAVAVQ